MTGTKPSRGERFDALTTDVLAAVRRHDPDWIGTNSNDPGVMLAELLAWVGDRLSAYQDRIAGEATLEGAHAGLLEPFVGLSSRVDPYRNFRFRVTLDGVVVPGITRISALRRSAQVLEHRDGADPDTVQRLPGRMEYDPITLERGVTRDTTFEDWANQIRQLSAGGGQGTAAAAYRKNIRIEVLNQAGQPVIAYDVYRCWPASYRPLPDLEAGESARLIEAITLVHDGWVRDLTVVLPADPP
jgi:phage tail-like protein